MLLLVWLLLLLFEHFTFSLSFYDGETAHQDLLCDRQDDVEPASYVVGKVEFLHHRRFRVYLRNTTPLVNRPEHALQILCHCRLPSIHSSAPSRRPREGAQGVSSKHAR